MIALMLAAALLQGADKPAAVAEPPPPDFKKPVDYVRWYTEQTTFAEADNAYTAYRRFMEPRQAPEFPSDSKSQYELLVDYPRPWEPGAYFDLTIWLQNMEPAMAAYFDGVERRYFAHPINRSADTLLQILKPGFTRSRTVSHAMLLKAWQEDPGFREDLLVHHLAALVMHVNHLHQSLTTFEHLTALEIREALYHHVVHAVKCPKVSKEAVEEIQTVLNKTDAVDLRRVIQRSLVHEMAAGFSLVQALCRTADGLQPKFQADKLKPWLRRYGHDPESDLTELLREDPRKTCTLIRDYYRDLIRAADRALSAKLLAKAAETYKATIARSPYLKIFLPKFEGTFKLYLAAEAQRRGVRLLTALAVARKGPGHWPATLSAAVDGDAAALEDPYSGKPFIYRAQGERMTLYAVGLDGTDNNGRQFDVHYGGQKGEDLVVWPPKSESATRPDHTGPLVGPPPAGGPPASGSTRP